MAPRPRLRFLGTGAAGGTPGSGRSLRRESSAALTDSAATILIEVTGDIRDQAGDLPGCGAVLLTHGHSDAIGGLARLAERDYPAPIPVYAAPATIDAAHRRFRNLDHLVFRSFQPGAERESPDGPSPAPRCPTPPTPSVSRSWRGA